MLIEGRAIALEISEESATDRDNYRSRATFDQRKTESTFPGKRWLPPIPP